MPNNSLPFSLHLDILTFPLSTPESMNILDGHLAKDVLDSGCLGIESPLSFLLIPQIDLIYFLCSYVTGIMSIMDLLIQLVIHLHSNIALVGQAISDL